jgi:hypothetical protein
MRGIMPLNDSVDTEQRVNTRPVPLAKFLAKIRGTSDEIWTKLLQVRHGIYAKKSISEWAEALAALKRE